MNFWNGVLTLSTNDFLPIPVACDGDVRSMGFLAHGDLLEFWVVKREPFLSAVVPDGSVNHVQDFLVGNRVYDGAPNIRLSL